jgi:hypothetical protein
MTFADVDAFAIRLPGVTIATSWGHRTWMVGKHAFAWQRPFSKADIRRFGDETPPAGEILAVRVESLDAKEALLEGALPGFFSIPHFQGFPALLIALRKARARDVRAAIEDAHAAKLALAAGRKRGPRNKARKQASRGAIPRHRK